MGRSKWSHLYTHSKWRRLRADFLRKYPLCHICSHENPPRITPAEVVDHRVPHKGDMSLFWDQDNWTPLCKKHHDGAKAKAESRGVQEVGCDTNGWPLDKGHTWYN